ncbi:MAG: SpoIID/LytB domain-containing protein [Prochlorococcus sp.]
MIVNEVNHEEYVSYVVRAEMPGGWNQEALEA